MSQSSIDIELETMDVERGAPLSSEQHDLPLPSAGTSPELEGGQDNGWDSGGRSFAESQVHTTAEAEMHERGGEGTEALTRCASPSDNASGGFFSLFPGVWSVARSGSPPGLPPVSLVVPPLPPLSDERPPDMVRESTSDSVSTASDGDDVMSDRGDDETMSSADEDSSRRLNAAKKGVSFNENVRVLPIPPLAAYTFEQRTGMYTNRFELRQTKARNKKEYEFDGKSSIFCSGLVCEIKTDANLGLSTHTCRLRLEKRHRRGEYGDMPPERRSAASSSSLEGTSGDHSHFFDSTLERVI